MRDIIHKIARFSAFIGGIVLTALALLMTLSIMGGAIAKIGYSDWLMRYSPFLADIIQQSGIRTIIGMYEIIKFGIAFVIFAFLPITTFERAHAVVDVFTNRLPKHLQHILIIMWEILFFIILMLITWRLFFGLERMMSAGIISQELKIPEWWGFAVAFLQMIFATAISAFVVFVEITSFFQNRSCSCKQITVKERA